MMDGNSIMIIPALYSPHQGGSNGGQIIEICFFYQFDGVKNESFVSFAT
jgi:hypothetical protein